MERHWGLSSAPPVICLLGGSPNSLGCWSETDGAYSLLDFGDRRPGKGSEDVVELRIVEDRRTVCWRRGMRDGG